MVSARTRQRLRHALVRHRRPLAAACAAGAVIVAFTALTPRTAVDSPATGSRASAVRDQWTAELPVGMVASPVRLADAEAARLLQQGSVVDVLAADGKGDARLVADGVDVLDVPPSDDAGWATAGFGGALVVLAVSDREAAALAAMAAVGPLSVVLVG